MAVKIFISYRRDDSAGHAGRIHDLLQQEFGPDSVFMDVDNIPFGAKFATVLDQEVAKCDLLLALIGRDWLIDRTGKRPVDDQRDYPRVEIASALKRDINVIPILLDGTMIPSADQLPDDLKGLPERHALDVRSSSFRGDVDRLIRDIKGFQSSRSKVVYTRQPKRGRETGAKPTDEAWERGTSAVSHETITKPEFRTLFTDFGRGSFNVIPFGVGRIVLTIGAVAGTIAALIALLNSYADFKKRCPGQSTLQCVWIAANPEPTIAELSQYIDRQYLQNKEVFDDKVDYFKLGVVSREEAIAEQQAQRKRYPIRTFKLSNDPVLVVTLEPDLYQVTFGYKYSKSGQDAIEGSGRAELVLRRTGGKFFVAKAKEIVDERKPVQPEATPK
jgi:TIR domain